MCSDGGDDGNDNVDGECDAQISVLSHKVCIDLLGIFCIGALILTP